MSTSGPQLQDAVPDVYRPTPVFVAGSSFVTGSRTLPSEDVDRAFGMPIGKLRSRAGIESLAFASESETELTLGARAAQQALRASECPNELVDCLIATSETHHIYPSLAAQLHGRLNLREDCGALDVGGACLGAVNALAAGKSLLADRRSRAVLIVTADVHSRTLAPGRVAGEFGGLFGDGATAFLLRGSAPAQGMPSYQLGEFIFGCAAQYSSAVTVAPTSQGSLHVHFEGEALSRAAIARLEKVFSSLESLSAIPRSAVGSFATHQPNPRLVTLLAKVAGVSVDAFPAIARTSGNLGRPPVARPCTPRCNFPSRSRPRGAARFLLLRWGPACFSAAAG